MRKMRHKNWKTYLNLPVSINEFMYGTKKKREVSTYAAYKYNGLCNQDCLLFGNKKRRVTTAKLASELKIPESYIPKITKQLKKEKIISASEGISGGYALAKNSEKISLFDVISCMESTMAISRCLEKDGFCSRNYTDCCKVHQVLLDLQNTYNNRLENVKISDIIRPGKDEYFGRFYIILKVNLAENSYECIYSHNRGFMMM